jgi:hypothetical protein
MWGAADHSGGQPAAPAAALSRHLTTPPPARTTSPPPSALLLQVPCVFWCGVAPQMPHHCPYCRLQRGWLWGSIAFARRGGRNETIIGERVSHFAWPAQGILTKCVHGVTFKGSRIGERRDWRWTPTTNQDVNGSTARSRHLGALHTTARRGADLARSRDGKQHSTMHGSPPSTDTGRPTTALSTRGIARRTAAKARTQHSRIAARCSGAPSASSPRWQALRPAQAHVWLHKREQQLGQQLGQQ